MTGREENILKYEKAIENVLANNLDKDYLRRFSNWLEVSLSTKRNYIQYAANFMDFCNNKPLDQITLEDYTDYMASVKGVSSYRIAVYSGLKRFSEWCFATKRNPEHCMSEMKRPKPIEDIKTTQKREVGFLSDNEAKEVLSNVKNRENRRGAFYERDMSIILLGLTTGLRCSAIYQLDIDSIDFENRKLMVLEKGSKIRKVSLTDETYNMLVSWINIRKPKDESEKALFISNKTGTRITTCGIFDIVEKYSNTIEGKHISPHKLRATYASKLYEKTGDIHLVQKNMGHSSPETTSLYIRGQEDRADQTAKDIMSGFVHELV